MIPDLLEQLRSAGVLPLIAGLVFVVVLTAVVFLAQSVAQWFVDRDS
ncbi:MAG: hypothetical protein JSS69_15600 [Acidobacteria bacterium]|nr:hypothetical protein [Acidobacteriota bacterium]MBS1867339.1 hypothetical protein [Acidobacteriota bacterium]